MSGEMVETDRIEKYRWDKFPDRLQTKYIGKRIFFYECTDSTNVRAKLLAEGREGYGYPCSEHGESHGDLGVSANSDMPECRDGSTRAEHHGTLVAADCQTAGRGRRGREWDSPAGKNIYFTLLLKPDFAPDKAPMLTLVMAMAVARGVEKIIGTPCSIKWPNDLVINGRKICGILTEMSVEQGRIAHVLIGVGINVNKQQFAPELVDKATDMETECGRSVSRQELLQTILEAFEEEYELFCKTCDLSGIRERYNACLVNSDREVRVLDPKGEYTGIARGINDVGELLVELPDGSVAEVYAGEVSVRGIYGYV